MYGQTGIGGQDPSWIPACDTTDNSLVYIEHSPNVDDCCYGWDGTNWAKRSCDNLVPGKCVALPYEKVCYTDGTDTLNGWITVDTGTPDITIHDINFNPINGVPGDTYTLFSKFGDPHPDAGTYGSTFTYIGELASGSIDPDQGGSDIGGWSVYSVCSETPPVDDTNGHFWRFGEPADFTWANYVSPPNTPPDCGTTATLLDDKYCDCPRQELIVSKLPLYEYKELWAEESAGLNNNSAEWSFGNGAAGFIGIPIGEGWEVVEMGFHADNFQAAATVTVELVDFTTPSTAAAVISSISLSNSTDGGGTTNNAYKLISLNQPIPSGAVLGFRTTGLTGAISDARVYARFRRQIGEYISEVQIQD